MLGIGLKIIPKSIRKQISGKPNPEAMHGPVRELLSTDTNKGNLSKARWKRCSKQKLRKMFRKLLLLVDSSKFWVPSRVPKIDQILDIVRFPRSQTNGDAGVASFSIFDAKPAATNFFIDCSLMWVSQIDFFWFRLLELARFVFNRANP